MNSKSIKNRIWELDFFRGIALLLMVYFHLIYDMKDMFGYSVSYDSGINFYTGRISALLFMFVSGISCSLSRSNLKRGLKLLGIALIITIVSHLYGPEFGIKFGILHFLGVCMLLYPLLKRLNGYLLFLLGTVIMLLKSITERIAVDFDWLFIFNITSRNFNSSDYYPIIPWLGVFIYGIVFSKIFYKERTSLFPISAGDNIVSRAGRHTLLIYVIHQPVIIILLTLLTRLKG